MLHLPPLIQDLAIILFSAGLTALVSKSLKFPVIFGYLGVGFLVGPHTPLFSSTVLSDPDSLKVWAELGVVFLLFGLGLEFSFRKLFRSGFGVVIIALVEILVCLMLGYFLSRAWGWSPTVSLFVGGLLSISSTTIILKSFEDLKIKSRKASQLVLGILVIEDVVAIFLMVLLSGFITAKEISGESFVTTAARIGFFLAVWVMLGISIIPSFFRRAGKHLSDELLIVIGVGLCLGMVYVSAETGFSSALGAFVMGSLLAETIKGERIHELMAPLKFVFGAIFFISVGMMFDLGAITQAGPLVVLTFGVVVAGKIFGNLLGGLFAGFDFKTSLQSGLSLAQIGEFSFILAGLAATLPGAPKEIYPLTIAVATLSSLTTPVFISKAQPISEWVEKNILPESLNLRIQKYRILTQRGAANSEWSSYLKQQFFSVGFSCVWVVFSAVIFNRVLRPWAELHLFNLPGDIVSLLVILLLAAPVLWSLTVGTLRDNRIVVFWRSFPEIRLQIALLILAKIVLAMVLVLFSMGQTIGFRGGVLIALGSLAVLVLLFSRFLEKAYKKIIDHLTKNFSAGDEIHSDRGKGYRMDSLVPWDAHIAKQIVSAGAKICGKSLEEAKIREHFGVTVALIRRGERRIWVPGREEKILPGDQLFFIGTDFEVDNFKNFIEEKSSEVDLEAETFEAQLGLESLELREGSQFLGRTIRDSGLRELVKGLVVGVERAGKRVLNPDSNWVLETGDLLWIVGDKDKITQLRKS